MAYDIRLLQTAFAHELEDTSVIQLEAGEWP